MATGKSKRLSVLGATLHGFAQACINLNVVAASEVSDLLKDIEMRGWYPFERLYVLELRVTAAYDNAGPILERVGAEMTLAWYHHGSGKDIVKRGVDFLHFQAGSQGYHSMVKGPEKQVGSFDLLEIDEARGSALIHSTDPLNKDLERGLIIGGMSAPGDLDFIDVDNSDSPQRFKIEFH